MYFTQQCLVIVPYHVSYWAEKCFAISMQVLLGGNSVVSMVAHMQCVVMDLLLCIRTVQVIKLISKDTIEDCILQLGNKKLKLEQDMISSEQSKEIFKDMCCTYFHRRFL